VLTGWEEGGRKGREWVQGTRPRTRARQHKFKRMEVARTAKGREEFSPVVVEGELEKRMEPKPGK